MDLSKKIEDARMQFRTRVLFTGENSPKTRMFYRLLSSLQTAVKEGMEDITLYLTKADFWCLCAAYGVDPNEAQSQNLLLTDEVPISTPEQEPPFSIFGGFYADGRTAAFPVMPDEEFAALV